MNREPTDGVGARLKADRNAVKLSQRALASAIATAKHGVVPPKTRATARLRWLDKREVYRRYVSRWESLTGHNGMEPEYAQLVAELLGTNADRYIAARFNPRERLARRLEQLQEETRQVLDEIDRLPPP